jgi:hypothetical protein
MLRAMTLSKYEGSLLARNPRRMSNAKQTIVANTKMTKSNSRVLHFLIGIGSQYLLVAVPPMPKIRSIARCGTSPTS